MIKKVKAIVSRVELRNHIQAKRNAKEEYEISKECVTMDTATRKSYEDAIEQYTVTISELEHSEDWDVAGNYRECLKELKGEYEELQTEAGWAQYLDYMQAKRNAAEELNTSKKNNNEKDGLNNEKESI